MKVLERDVIRAYDFKPMVGRGDCFIEGEVLDAHSMENGYQSYKIRVTRDYFDDAEHTGMGSRIGKIYYIPQKVVYNDYAGRVINLSRI